MHLLWPLPVWVNLWSGVEPLEWFVLLMQPVEFLLFGLFFLWLERRARQLNTDRAYLSNLRV